MPESVTHVPGMNCHEGRRVDVEELDVVLIEPDTMQVNLAAAGMRRDA